MLQKETLLDVVGKSRFCYGVLQSFRVEIIEQGNEWKECSIYRLENPTFPGGGPGGPDISGGRLATKGAATRLTLQFLSFYGEG
ncbi:hypothetical protein Tco_1054418 [Tanacetum coccineum]|uniref:Uncharacterized protein n=1 Tax=Tanacetum coccineum TaxID=301880 RepID=A0ABQ5GWQ4_9ASTR